MPLDGTRCGDAIMDALVTAGIAEDSGPARQAWQIAATEILAELTANGVVTSSAIAVPAHAPGGAATAVLSDGAIS